jgi:hypothetical protein
MEPVNSDDLVRAIESCQEAQKNLEKGRDSPKYGVFLAIELADIESAIEACKVLKLLLDQSSPDVIEEAKQEFKRRACLVGPSIRDRAESIGSLVLPRFSPTS